MVNGHFNDAGGDYAALMRQPWHTLRLRSTFANIVRHGTTEGTWLDLGAGTGENALMLVESGARVIATDPAPTMAVALSGLAARTPGMTVSKLTDLTCRQASAAGVTLHNVVEYADDRAQLIALAASCVRPGGLLSILCANPSFALYRLAVRGATPTELLEAADKGQTMVGMPEHRFGVPDYTVDECVRSVTAHGLDLLDHRGVRVLSDFAPEHPSQHVDGWAAQMLQLDDLLGGQEPYRSTSRHWHLIFRNQHHAHRLPTAQQPNSGWPHGGMHIELV